MRISVDGNIGAGKTTVLDALEKAFPTVSIFREPLHEWSDLLRLYYADPALWSLPLNLKVLKAFRASSSIPTEDVAIVERSPISCRYVFAQLQHNDDGFNKAQWEVFKEYYDVLGWEPDAIVFVRASAGDCFRRVCERARPCERAVDLEYLKRVEFQYDNMLKTFKHIPVCVIDGTHDIQRVCSDAIEAVGRLIEKNITSV